MSVHLQHQIERLKKDLLSLGTTVEEQVQMAVRALLDRDEEMARQVEHRASTPTSARLRSKRSV